VPNPPTTGPLGFLPLGVGDAFSSQHYASSLLVGFEGEWLLIDCPHPIRKMLHEACSTAGWKLDLDAVRSVVLTHLHADHCSGVEGFLYFHHFALQSKPTLIAHPDVAARLWSGHLAAGMDAVMDTKDMSVQPHTLEDFASLLPISDEREVTVGPFSIACRKTLHTVPTTALRIRAGDRCLGYSADTSFDPSLIEWLSEADLFVHETNLGIHTDYEQLRRLPASLRDRMRLIHYPDFFDLDASQIEPLHQGHWYRV
jgi:ribonuclease BN (tRNA processing enzyme)